MAVMTIANEPPLRLPLGRPLTVADLEGVPNDGHRYELVDGVLIVTPAPLDIHQGILGKLFLTLSQACLPGLKVRFAPYDVELAEDTVLQPDLLVTRAADITPHGLKRTPPLLAVEILSPSTRRFDLLLKHSRYQDAGCRSYWVIDPRADTGEPRLIAWELHDDHYEEAADITGEETWTATRPLPGDADSGGAARLTRGSSGGEGTRHCEGDDTMRAAIIDAPGATAHAGEFDEPEPAEAESVMDVLAAAIHPIVRSTASGEHYGSEGRYPMVPGVDCVARGADGVARYAGFIRPPWGTLAERAAARMGLPLPHGADPVAIAGALNPGMSSWLPLIGRRRERTEDGEGLGTVVVVGATGVAGRIAVQSALALGADRVVGLGRDAGRLAEVGRLGGIPVAIGDGTEALTRALDGSAPSLVLDYAWGPAAEILWDALERHGMEDDDADILHVQIGTTAGARAALPGSLLRSRRLTVRGSGAGSVPVADIVAELPAFMERIAAGDVVAPVRVFPLSRVDQAWAYSGPDRAVVVPD